MHVQKSTQKIDRLQAAGTRCDPRVYPGKNHSIAARPTRLHLHSTRTGYVRENLVGLPRP